jgi:hypothetical protein
MTVNLLNKNLSSLYEDDYLAWYETNLELIKERHFDDLDLDNLIQELENLVRNIKHSGESFLEQIIRHLLMIEYWEQERDYNFRHWVGEIINFRNELDIDLTTNLRKHLAQEQEKIYQKAVKYVVGKTGLKKGIFPTNCPYTLEQLIDSDWLPFLDETWLE